MFFCLGFSKKQRNRKIGKKPKGIKGNNEETARSRRS